MASAATRGDYREALIRQTRGLILVAAAAALGSLAVVDPRTAVAGMVVVVVGVICAIRADVALLLLVAVIPLESQYAALPVVGLTPTKAAGALCFLSFAFYTLRSRRRLVFDVSHGIVVSLLALALVSTLFAHEADPALSATLRYGGFVALYFVVSQFVGDFALQRRIAWTLCISASVASLIALESFFFDPGYVYRANLAYGDPNDVAFHLAATLPLAFWLLGQQRAWRPIVLGMITVISLATVFTYSRGALVGIGAGILFLMLTDRKRIPLLAAAGVVTIAAGSLIVRSSPETSLRFEDALRAKQQVASTNVDARLDAYSAAATLAADNPIVGIGPGNFSHHYREVAGFPPGVEHVTVVHNSYLDVASELGLIGLVLFVAYLALVFFRLTAVVRMGGRLGGYASALRISFVITLVAGFTISEQYSAPYWLIGGLATAQWLETRPAAVRAASNALRHRPAWTGSR